MEHLNLGPEAVALPAVLDLIAASALLEAFLGRRGRALAVDGASVERLGAQCLQVLLAARAAWAADDLNLVVHDMSEDFTATLQLLGVTPETLNYHKGFSA